MNRAILWIGRALAVALTVLTAGEYLGGGPASTDTRMIVIIFVAVVFTTLALWQVMVAKWRDGWPTMPPTFRWVMALFLLSIAAFTVWSVLVASTEIYSRELSILMWYQLGMSSIYFLVRWINLGGPRQADIGETGTSG